MADSFYPHDNKEDNPQNTGPLLSGMVSIGGTNSDPASLSNLFRDYPSFPACRHPIDLLWSRDSLMASQMVEMDTHCYHPYCLFSVGRAWPGI